jgi:hypothetical protein
MGSFDTVGKCGVFVFGIVDCDVLLDGGVVTVEVLTLPCGAEEPLLRTVEGVGHFGALDLSLNKSGWSAIHASPSHPPSSIRKAHCASAL